MGLTPRSQFRHAVSVVRRGDGVTLLVRGTGGRDEEEPVEAAVRDNAPGNGQMAGVNRVERSPVNTEPADFHGELPLPEAPGAPPSWACSLVAAGLDRLAGSADSVGSADSDGPDGST